MNITPATLYAQYTAALKAWPFIPGIEQRYGLPPYLLFAVGSRETNLRNVIGDGGHGVGIWQRNDRSWPFPKGKDWYLNHTWQQSVDAATLLVSNYNYLGNWPDAVAAYNAGAGAVMSARKRGATADSVTTGHDYSADVMARRDALVAKFAKTSAIKRAAGFFLPR